MSRLRVATSACSASTTSRHNAGRRVVERLESVVGGAARLRAVLLLAGVLSLTSADMATVGATATQLKSSLHIGNTDIGLLVTVSSGIAVFTTLPFGMLADRVPRVRLLVISIVSWSVMMVACAAAPTFLFLLVFRIALGAALAGAAPLVASLTGDLFEPSERGRIYGYILGGELLGAGFGLLVCGDVAAASTWRASFALLAVLGVLLAWVIGRGLPEPARGGRSRLQVGEADLRAAIDAGVDESDAAGDAEAIPSSDATPLGSAIRGQQIQAHADQTLRKDPTGQGLRSAIRYVLSIRTNVVLIIASALGYFFFAGLRTFAVVFAKARFGLGQGAASGLLILIGAGALVGILLAGRVGDALILRRRVDARPLVGGVAFLFAVALFIPALLTTSLLLAAPLLFLAVAGVGGANPPLDAARLDIMPAALWGRAESVRTVLRTGLEALAPLLFGYVSTQLGGAGGSSGYGHPTAAQPHAALGLDHTLLVMLTPLAAAGLLLLLLARRTYPRDVATALASERAVATTATTHPGRTSAPVDRSSQIAHGDQAKEHP
ncbi:MAG: MFS transporter [Actinomycetota bacterium]|nr:MFS transporter [Actinomycetota bacterium]